MGSSFNFYHTIDDAKVTKDKITFLNNTIVVNIDRKYYFLISGSKQYIDEEVIEGKNDEISIKLFDSNYEWSEDNIYLEYSLEFKNIKYLFGKTGIVYQDAKIGVGLEWKCQKSRIKKCCKLGSISFDDENKILSQDILVSDLSSDVKFILKFYIDKEGEKNGDISFANQKGLILGNFNVLNIVTKGNASIFPIVEFFDKEGPLWKCELSYTDIYEDSFDDENVKVLINKGHKSYQFLQENHRNFNPYFQSETLSSALSVMLLMIIEKEEKIDFSKSYEEGSIAQALKYFHEALDVKINDGYNQLTRSVKCLFDKEFK